MSVRGLHRCRQPPAANVVGTWLSAAREGRTTREATSKGSTSTGARFGGFRTAIGAADRLAVGVAVVSAIAGVLMIVSELTSIASVDM